MVKATKRINPKIVTLARQLRRKLDEILLKDERSVFLCGGNTTPERAYRRRLASSFASLRSNYYYKVFLAEDLFIDLLLGHEKRELVNLETSLARYVDLIVLFPESPGSFTELGVFAFKEDLGAKLVVVNHPKYRMSKGFITYGPIRHMKTHNVGKVIYKATDINHTDSMVREILDAAALFKVRGAQKTLLNPIYAFDYYLSLIYVMGPIPKDALIEISKKLLESEDTTVVQTVLSGLISERKIILGSTGFSISSVGKQSLFAESKRPTKIRKLRPLMTNLRLEALDLTLRKNREGDSWGEIWSLDQ